MSAPTYQEMILRLERFWADYGCVIQQPYHTEVGAGTFNPATFLRCLGPEPWKSAYVEPSLRPSDGRYGENPYRFQQFWQYQVVLKPAPDDVLDIYFESLKALGIDPVEHDVRLVEDDWEGPTLGAWGLGWEVWIDGLEVTQFTYFQQLGGLDLDLITAEIVYGTERLAMYLQDKTSAFDLEWAPGRDLGRRLPRERAPVVGLQLRARRRRAPDPPLRGGRARVRAAARAGPADPGLRPRAQVLAHVQPARRARGHLGDRAGLLHRARPRRSRGAVADRLPGGDRAVAPL